MTDNISVFRIFNVPRPMLGRVRFLRHILLELVAVLKMHLPPAKWYHRLLGIDPLILTYRTRDGEGDKGVTIFVPMIESFIALDSWPEEKEAVLVIASCKPYDSQVVLDFIQGHFFGSVDKLL